MYRTYGMLQRAMDGGAAIFLENTAVTLLSRYGVIACLTLAY